MNWNELNKIRGTLEYEIQLAIDRAYCAYLDEIEPQVLLEFEDYTGTNPDAAYERRLDKLLEKQKPAIIARVRAEFETQIPHQS